MTFYMAAAICLLLLGTACSRKENKLDKFAQCLSQKGATMYGAYWCPHCKDQKDEFGDSFKYIQYVECSVPGQPISMQTEACKARDIKQYPTWTFGDGTRIDGIESMQQLAERTGCQVPPPEK